MPQPTDLLSEKEKETLRLIVRGHDAKSMARELDLSVHTINDRLRAARRKLGVTSSKEAARMLLEQESGSPEYSAYQQLGDESASADAPLSSHPARALSQSRWVAPRAALIAGGLIMLTLISAIALSFAAHPSEEAVQFGEAAQTATTDAEVLGAAQAWLALVDDGDWQASWDAAGEAFREPNTLAGWTSASEQVRPPLGDVLARTPLSQDHVNAPPMGYILQRFKTDFENRNGAIETVTLMREDGEWRAVGYFIS
ncbi:DUF4019 domain-containing protein [Qipengyuania sp. DSG2-2]|uniref:DUF4019 domain-containing protein n=1 Tax=Qipengyuania sp. DGS2-2 TaxID=3349631 RepID=UPI0036D3F8D0